MPRNDAPRESGTVPLRADPPNGSRVPPRDRDRGGGGWHGDNRGAPWMAFTRSGKRVANSDHARGSPRPRSSRSGGYLTGRLQHATRPEAPGWNSVRSEIARGAARPHAGRPAHRRGPTHMAAGMIQWLPESISVYVNLIIDIGNMRPTTRHTHRRRIARLFSCVGVGLRRAFGVAMACKPRCDRAIAERREPGANSQAMCVARSYDPVTKSDTIPPIWGLPRTRIFDTHCSYASWA